MPTLLMDSGCYAKTLGSSSRPALESVNRTILEDPWTVYSLDGKTRGVQRQYRTALP